MYNVDKKNEIIKCFLQNVDTGMSIVRESYNLYESLESGDLDTASRIIREMGTVVTNYVPCDLPVRKALIVHTFKGTDDKVSGLNIIVRRRSVKSEEGKSKFKLERTIAVTETIMDDALDFLKCVYAELIEDSLITLNVEEVNKKFAEVAEKAGVGYTVGLISPLGYEGKTIASITDDEILYVADAEKIFALGELILFNEESDLISKEDIEAAFNKEVEMFMQAQTTPQFVKVKDPYIYFICNLNKLVKYTTVIRKTVSKKATNKITNGSVASYLKDDVYSVVRRDGDEFEVVLHPFNLKTLEPVEVDVLKEIGVN